MQDLGGFGHFSAESVLKLSHDRTSDTRRLAERVPNGFQLSKDSGHDSADLHQLFGWSAQCMTGELVYK